MARVAVIADAHFHDIEGDYDFPGIVVNGRRLTVRTFADTARSTRVYNESFAALPAALDRIVAMGIRHVVLLGDYSDDGQRGTVASLVRLLAAYRDRHGLRFYATPGNHDVFGPLMPRARLREIRRPPEGSPDGVGRCAPTAPT